MEQTTVIFVRHAESPYSAVNERERELSAKGLADAERVKGILRGEGIDVFFSSPYERAIQTVKPSALEAGKEIVIEEDLRERRLSGVDHPISKEEFFEAKQRVFEDFDYAYPGGESSNEAQSRAAAVLRRLLQQYAGQKIVIGTHGDIMTLMMNHFDKAYDFEFWKRTAMPDIYRLVLTGVELIEVQRLWKEG